MSLSNEERKAILSVVPWIVKLKRPVQCQGFMNHTALKHIHGTDEQRAQKPVCRNRAFWKFTHSKRCEFHNGETEYYCTSHLYSRGVFGCMYEDNRFKTWYIKYEEGQRGSQPGT
jgi:hypothetical protein